ncbi:MAG TPA: TadE family protein [Archangium sp.]|uniref:TadE/TadG family type IV pilus assembly protein n=1 Tax=Archangium sp. TaxID=1872627 RepID=UPI002E3365CB|nr:TadE family protein [Archangium sp.]HEX5746199.1 TadE family protein [Archangium sp.]
MNARQPRERQSGQAMVETALTLPLMVFLILGTLQLFLMFQGRVLAQYAAFRATRAGSVNHGDCERMKHAAVLALLPSFDSFLSPSKPGGSRAQKLALAFAARKDNKFNPAKDSGHDGHIVWLMRESPRAADVDGDQDRSFDQPGNLMRLEVRLIYWFPMRVPFANWVISRMFLAHLGLRDYTAANPLMPTDKDRWTREPGSGDLRADVRSELLSRIGKRQYTLPIETSFTMRMMTPAIRAHFSSPMCR